jgi:hypothetical protein
MPDHRLPPDERRIRDDMLRRIDLLERRLSRGAGHEPIFESHSLGGTIYPSVSGLYYPPRSGRLVYIVTSLATPGTTSTVVKMYRGGVDGTLLETITLAAGQGYEPVGCNHYCPDSQPLQWEITSAGAGAKTLNIQTEILPGR